MSLFHLFIKRKVFAGENLEIQKNTKKKKLTHEIITGYILLGVLLVQSPNHVHRAGVTMPLATSESFWYVVSTSRH